MIKQFTYKDKPKRIGVLKESAQYLEGLDMDVAEAMPNENLALLWPKTKEYLKKITLKKIDGLDEVFVAENTEDSEILIKPFISSYRKFTKSLIVPLDSEEEKKVENPEDEITILYVLAGPEIQHSITTKHKRNTLITSANIAEVAKTLNFDPASVKKITIKHEPSSFSSQEERLKQLMEEKEINLREYVVTHSCVVLLYRGYLQFVPYQPNA